LLSLFRYLDDSAPKFRESRLLQVFSDKRAIDLLVEAYIDYEEAIQRAKAEIMKQVNSYFNFSDSLLTPSNRIYLRKKRQLRYWMQE